MATFVLHKSFSSSIINENIMETFVLKNRFRPHPLAEGPGFVVVVVGTVAGVVVVVVVVGIAAAVIVAVIVVVQ